MKISNSLMLLMMPAAFCLLASCSKEDPVLPRFNLTLKPTLPAEYTADKVKDIRIVLVSESSKDTFELKTLKDTTLNMRQGAYQVTISGKSTEEATTSFLGKSAVSLYQDVTTTVALGKVSRSTLVFKAIHNSGSKEYYLKESYFEIANNSDEVQYLDNLIISAPSGNHTAPNAWQSHNMAHLYDCGQGSVIAFPGTGRDYPLQPGQSVLIANNATDHRLGYGTDETQKEAYAACPDLSKADWEIYLDYNANDVDYEARNMKIVFYNNKYMFAFGLGVMGRSYLLAKLPDGMTVDQFASDERYLMYQPGSASTTMNYLCVPSAFVLDAVDIYNPDTENHVCTFLPVDDATGIKGNKAYSGKCVRRKVERIANGRPYYKDTNSSADDFLRDQPLTPGVTPTVAD